MRFRLPIHYLLFSACCGVSIKAETDWHFAGVNIAYGKAATQGPGTYSNTLNSETKNYTADLAVDGDNSTIFNDGSCTHTTGSSSTDAFWTLELQKGYKITGLVIYNRNEKKLRIRIKNFIIYGNENVVIHNSTGTSEYENPVIYIPVNETRYFSSVTVKLPANRGHPERGKYFLTLCEVEIYAATCGYLHITNGEMTPNQTLYEVNKQARIVCNEGFEPTEQNITCSNNKTWTYYKPCSLVYCAYPGKPINGDYLNFQNQTIYFSFTLPYGSVITVKCDLGYRSENTENRTCQFDGTWSGEAPVCTKVQCSYPVDIANCEYQLQNGSKYESGSSEYNTTVQVICLKGYTINGDKERTCNANKTWSGEAKCSLVTCTLPRMPEGGFYGIKGSNGSLIQYNNTVSNYSYEIHAICPKGKILNLTSNVRRCLETGLWSGEHGKCGLMTCRQPDEILNGFYNYTKEFSSERVPFNTVLTAVCDENFKLVNPENRKRRCNDAGVWDTEPPLCVKMQEHSETSKAGLIAGTVSAAGLIISATSVALLIFFCRRRKLKDNTERSMRYRNMQTENASKMSTKASSHENTDAVYSKEGTSTGVLDKTSDGRERSREYSYTMPDEVIPAVVSSSSLQSDREYYSFTGMEKIPATAIKIQDLSDLTLSDTGAKERFQKEFEKLPQGMVEAHMDALKPQNKGKNRFKNLYAYDDTRVILDVEDEPDSDYINACFVHGFNKTRKYIASQVVDILFPQLRALAIGHLLTMDVACGTVCHRILPMSHNTITKDHNGNKGPTKKILNDFWRMIWQTGCCKIVTLTNLHEEGKVKCEQYWPSHGSKTYGRITVKMKQAEPFSQFVIRTFTVQKDGSLDRSVNQFHFTAWPDRGVPKSTSAMVQFLSKVKHFPSHGDGPIIVHCSAGVGRTGTFIALDNVAEQGKAMGYVDVAGVVESMRRQRVSAVQTLEQYIFVYQAVTEALMLSTSAVPAAKFPELYTESLQTDIKKKKRKISLEFEDLKKMSPVTDEIQYVSCKLARNRNKNRYSNVLPVEEYMPSLTKGDGTDECEYINAVFLPSYKEKKAFIITQTPLESTVEDFWRLIWEHDVRTLIMMNSPEEMANSEVYWPNDDQTVSFGNISITNDSTTINKHTVFSLTVKKFIVSRRIRLFQVGGWNSQKSLPESTDVILSLMELVQSWQQQTGNHTILVHCMNGVEKSGLFCVISAVIERMKIEQDVAIPQVIEEMRNAREQIIPSVEQFQFCHDAVLAFIHQYDTYSNFTI